ncbi:MAG: hypothetical protein K0U98_08625 [Deltaproteobacteria bacterium]|nr:hypothetical protein [Deltaproteobacteria bacterium]
MNYLKRLQNRFQYLILGLVAGLLALAIDPSLSAQEERVELSEERDVYNKVFDNLDGTKTLHSGLEPLHYRPSGGEAFLNINPTLVEEEGWHNETNSFPSRLPEMLGEGAALELGPDYGIRWRPGALVARTTSGQDIELGLAAPSWGTRSEELENTVIYPDLYPGLDLALEVRRGSLNVKTLFRDWLFELAPEQIDFLYIEAQMESDASLLEAVEERSNEGEAFEEIPLYFGRSTEDYVIGLFGHPGVPDAHLEDHSEALYKDEEGDWSPGPDGWRSNMADFLSTGTIRHFFRPPAITHLQAFGGTDSSAALTASFAFTARTTLEKIRFFSVSYSAADFGKGGASLFGFTYRCPPGASGGCRIYNNILIAGKAEDRLYRTVVSFRGILPFADSLIADPAIEIVDMQLGFSGAYSQPNYTGFSGFTTDEIIAYSAVFALSDPKRPGRFKIKNQPTVFSNPYNEEMRSVPGGTIKTSTWSPFSQQSSQRTIDSSPFQFGKLSNKRPGSLVPRAIEDFRILSLQRRLAMTMILAMPFDATPCPLCTANHPDPAIQAMNGDYQVGVMFSKLRLEFTTRKTTGRAATLTATSVGGHNDRLYPGETRSWDVELTAFSGTPDTLELNNVMWDPAHGVDMWFTDPTTGNTVYNPPLATVGDKVRVHAKWTTADPTLYGKAKKLEIFGWFRSAATSAGGSAEIPIHLKAPEGSPAFNQVLTSVDDNVTTATILATLQLPSQGLRAATNARGVLEWVSGPTKKLKEGQHWAAGSPASPGNDGDLLIYPDQFKPGTYKVNLIPCLWPTGQISAFHCLQGQKQQITFDVLAAVPGHPPSIDFVSPWSVKNVRNSPVTISVLGLNLVDPNQPTRMQIHGLIPLTIVQSGATNNKVSLVATPNPFQYCGPDELKVVTSAGVATAVFNQTKPFSSGTNYFAVEAETGILTQLKWLSLPASSNGNVVSQDGTRSGKLTIFFQVPATANYQVYTAYKTPGNGPARGKVTILEDDPVTGSRTTVKSFTHSLAAAYGPIGGPPLYGLRPLTDIRQVAGASRFNLSAGKYYRLELETIAGQDFPLYDMLVFTDGNLGPKLSELCF